MWPLLYASRLDDFQTFLNIFSKFREFSGFHAGIFNDFLISTKKLLKIYAIVASLDVTPLLVLRVNFCL